MLQQKNKSFDKTIKAVILLVKYWQICFFNTVQRTAKATGFSVPTIL